MLPAMSKCYHVASSDVTKRADIHILFHRVDVDNNIKHTLHRTVIVLTLDAWDLYEDKNASL